MTKAAKVAGFSYKAAWDAVQAINNLLPRPAFVTRTGGKRGGGAEVTEEGRKLIAAFHRLEEKLARISGAIAAEGLDNFDDLLLWGLAVKISARKLPLHASELTKIPSSRPDLLRVSAANDIAAIITHGAGRGPAPHAGTQRRRPGQILFRDFSRRPGSRSAVQGRNKLLGHATRRVDGANNSEVQTRYRRRQDPHRRRLKGERRRSANRRATGSPPSSTLPTSCSPPTSARRSPNGAKSSAAGPAI